MRGELGRATYRRWAIGLGCRKWTVPLARPVAPRLESGAEGRNRTATLEFSVLAGCVQHRLLTSVLISKEPPTGVRLSGCVRLRSPRLLSATPSSGVFLNSPAAHWLGGCRRVGPARSSLNAHVSSKEWSLSRLLATVGSASLSGDQPRYGQLRRSAPARRTRRSTS